jgi:putative ABC transport system substrate-binding protein
VTGPDTFIEVARQATTTVPIVMVYGSDPVGRGYIASLARPGGNITGLTWEPSPEIVGKYIEFLSELSPRPSRIACLVDPATPEEPFRKEADTAARRRGVTLYFVEVRAKSDVTNAFSTVGSSRVDAVIIFGGPALWSYRKQIADLAKKSRLATVYRYREGPEAGGLMSYGPSLMDSWRRAATYVDKILKGAKPSDLPVQQPTQFELVINLKTAKAIGLTIPPSLLGRADEVIQ